MNSIRRILVLLKHIPTNYNLVKRVFTSFNNLHFDAFDAEQIEQEGNYGVMYSLAGSRVHEMRGQKLIVSLTEEESISLITLAASISDSNCLLDVLLSDYCSYGENRKKRSKLYKIFSHYIKTQLIDSQSLKQFQLKCTRKILCNENWMKDINFLRSNNNERIKVLRAYTHALIHSSLFVTSVNYRNVMQTFTIAEMVNKLFLKKLIEKMVRNVLVS